MSHQDLQTGTAPAFPPMYDYVLAQRCYTCGAAAGTVCVSPQKQADAEQTDSMREQIGQPPFERDPLHLMHARRVDAGIRHYDRDVRKAPWPEDRVPARRYDSLG